MTIRTRIIAISVVAILVAAAVGWLTMAPQLQQTLNDREHERQDQLIVYTRRLVDVYFGEAQRKIESLAVDPEVIALVQGNAGLGSAVNDKLTAGLVQASILDDLAVHDITCVPRACDAKCLKVIGGDYSDRDYCRGVKETKAAYLSGGFNSAVTQKPVIGLAVPVKSGLGEMVGYVVGIVNLARLNDSLADLQVGGFTGILDRYGNHIVGTLFSDMKLAKPGESVAADINMVTARLQAGETTNFFEDNDGHLVSFRKYDDMTIIVGQPNAPQLAVEKKISIQTSASLAVTLLAVMLVNILIAFSIGRRLKMLGRNIDDISRGKMDTKIDSKLMTSRDEIGDLARAFDRTLVSLKLAMRYGQKDRSDGEPSGPPAEKPPKG